MKINWGKGIVIAMVLFMLFILSFVYKTFTNSKYDHHLVTKEYYKDELNYQKEIDAVAKANKLNEKVKLNTIDKGIEIIFPSELKEKNIVGSVKFTRSADDKLDFNLPISLENGKMLVPDAKLVKGIYIVNISWKIDNEAYLFKDNFYY